MASHLKIPVSELRDRLTQSEFIDWLVYLNQLDETDTKQDYYLAQIAAEVRRGLVDKPREVKVKDFLLAMVTEEKKAVQDSKAIWAACLNVSLKKN